MQLVKELKELLKEKRYSIAFAAKAMDISKTTLHLWMNGKYSGNIEKIEDAVDRFIEIEKLRDMNIYGAIVGKAVYEGKLSLKDALKAAEVK